jgi:sugar phosphate isomerase/epimerase
MKKIIKNKFGIVQGRLSKAPKNRLQFFPKNNWPDEFQKAKVVGLDFIELFAERKFNKTNPIWTINGCNRIKSLAKLNDLKLITLCDDHVIDKNIHKQYYLKYFDNLLAAAERLGIKSIILPLYEKSNLTNKNYQNFISTLKIILKKCSLKNINIYLESNIDAKIFLDLKKRVIFKNFFFLFDTGNRVKNKNYFKDIPIFNKNIKQVHIKDKNQEMKNVKIGNGLVDFKKVFSYLKKTKFEGNIVFESTREKNPIKTAIRNKKIIFDIISKNT